ncbi:hypothetical protein V8C86DRAFT_3030946 [Haematococcus lacustris]
MEAQVSHAADYQNKVALPHTYNLLSMHCCSLQHMHCSLLLLLMHCSLGGGCVVAALVALAMAMVLNVAAATDLSGSATSSPSSSTTKTNNDNGLPNPLVLAIQTLPFFRPVNVAGDDKGKVDPFDGDKGKGKLLTLAGWPITSAPGGLMQHEVLPAHCSCFMSRAQLHLHLLAPVAKGFICPPQDPCKCICSCPAVTCPSDPEASQEESSTEEVEGTDSK